jgi:gluconolactonase
MNSLPNSLSLLFLLLSSGAADFSAPEPTLLPDAVVDLDSAEGMRAVAGEWRFSEARIVEVDHRSPGPDLKASGSPNRTHDIVPRAGARNFDDRSWEVLAPGTLKTRRAGGKLCFAWYRLQFTIPALVGSFDTGGSTAVLEVVLDDYAEMWVDGKLPLTLGQAGGHLVKGWNAPNRVVLGRDLRPGREVQVAIFGANGPLSDPPPNFIWLRSASIEFYRAGKLDPARKVDLEVARLDPALDAVLPPQVRLERIAQGFGFTEGPVWVPEGYLLFSDPNLNRIHRWTPDGEVSVFRAKSGYAGMDIGQYGQPGSNGLALDGEGRLTICEHGNRRVTRLEKNGVLTVLADRYQGKRLNSPNDLVYRSDGVLYFTDPPFGLPRFFDDPRRELSFCGVYCLRGSELRLVSKDLAGLEELKLTGRLDRFDQSVVKT